MNSNLSPTNSQVQPFSLSVIEHRGRANALSGQCKLIYKFGAIGLAHFQYVTGHAVLRNDFNKELRQALQCCDLDPITFKSHSFRIGAATTAAQLGIADSQIRTLGRWKSDAFKQYINCAALTPTL